MSTNPFLHNSIPKSYSINNSPLKDLISNVKKTPSSSLPRFVLPIIQEAQLLPDNVKDGEIDTIEQILLAPSEVELSLLNVPIPPKIKDEYKNLDQKGLHDFFRMVVNVIGDGAMTGGDLDGGRAPPTYKLFHLLISDLIDSLPETDSDEHQILSNIKRGIEQILEHSKDLYNLYIDNAYSPKKLHDVSLKYAQKIYDLKWNESQVLYGGYSETGSKNASGHGLIYEFTRREDNLFDIHVYTSTGLKDIVDYPVGVKNKQETLARYSGVPADILFFNEDGIIKPGFIQSLHELHVFGIKDPNLKLNIADVDRVFSYLDDYKVPLALNEKGLITGQIGGTCCASVMKVFIRHHCGHLGLYKQVIHRIKSRLLALAFKILKDSTKGKSKEKRQMFLRVARNLFRNTKKLLKGDHGFGPLISVNTAKQSLATACDIISQVKKIEAQVKIDELGHSTPVLLENVEIQIQRANRANLSHVDSARNNVTKFNEYLSAEDISSISPNFVLSAQEFVKRLNGITSSTAFNKNEIALFEISSFLNKIPIPVSKGANPFWDKVSTEDLKEFQNSLFLIGKTYQNLIDSTSLESFQQRVITLTVLQALSHYIAVKIEGIYEGKASLNHYRIPIFYDLLKNNEIMFFERVDLERFNSAKDYISKVNSSAQSRTHLFLNEKSCAVEKKEIKNDNDNGIFWHALLDLKPNIKANAIEKANSRWQDPSSNPSQHSTFKHQFDVPIDTKLTLLMEECDVDAKNDFLKESKLEHLSVYRFFTRFAHHYCYKEKPAPIAARNAQVQELNSSCWITGYFTQSELLFQDIDLNHLHRPVANVENINPHILKRNQREWHANIAEGENFSGNDTLYKRIERTLSQWELSPNQILYELAKDLNALKDPKIQEWILRRFFRSPILEGDVWKLGAGELIRTNQAFLDNACDFINRSLMMAEKMPDGILLARFLFELSFYLSKYLADAGEFNRAENLNQITSINRWLKFKEIKEEDRLFLHHFITAFYSTKPFLSDDDLIDALASWSAFHLLPSLNIEILSPTLYKLISRFILSQTTALSKKIQNPVFRMKAGVHILSVALHRGESDEPWEIFNRHYIQSGNWTINLFTGDIYESNAQLKGVPKSKYLTGDSLKRLFKNHSSLCYRQIGEGLITFYEQGSNYFLPFDDVGFKVEKEFRCYARQMTYNNILSSNDSFPNYLAYDHAFWMSTPFKHGNYEIKGVFTDLVHKKITHILLSDGRIVEADPLTGLPKKNARYLDKISLSKGTDIEESALLNFDQEKNIVLYRNEDDSLNSLVFSRYKSLDGHKLTFTMQNGQLIWNENKDCILPKSFKNSCLGSFKHYLYLTSRKGNKGMILVPFGEFLEVEEGSGKTEFYSGALSPILKSNASKEHTGNQLYFVFEENQGQIKPTSPESAIYLALIHLTEKNFEESFQLLKILSKTEVLSTASLKILEMILKLPQEDDFPHSSQVRLYALNLLLLQNELTSNGTKQVGNEFVKPGRETFQRAYNSQNNISKICRLSLEEELRIINYLKTKTEEDEHVNVINNNIILLTERYKYLTTKAVNQIGSKRNLTTPLVTAEQSAELINQHSFFCPGNEDLFSRYDPNETAYYPNILPLYITSSKNKITKATLAYSNTKLFFDVYKIAKSGNRSEKRLMIYRISQWRSQKKDGAFDCLLALLLETDKFPPLPANLDNLDEMIRFIQVFEEQYNKKKYLVKPFIRSRYVESKESNEKNYPYRNNFEQSTPQKTLADIHPKAIPLNEKLDPQKARWDALKSWKETWIKSSPKIDPQKVEKNPSFKFAFREDLLKNKEKAYVDSLKKDMEEFQRDFEEGQRQNLDAKQYSVTAEDCNQLLIIADIEFRSIQNQKKRKEIEILSLANKMNLNQDEKLVEVTELGGQQSNSVTIQDCIEALLSYNGRTYQLKNKNLQDPALVKEIADLTLEYLDMNSYEEQLKNIVNTAEQITDIDQKKPEEQSEAAPTRRYLCQNLHTHLDSKYNFDEFSSEEQVILRTFAGQSGFIPYKKQTDLIKKMLQMSKDDPQRFKDIVIQLIMGGGKTSVIATILLYMASRRKGRLALFIVPGSLMHTVYANLSKSLKTGFGKDLVQLDLQRDDFTLYRLEKTHQLNKKCINENIPMLVSATTLQGFELEMLSLARRIKSNIFELAKLKKQSASNGNNANLKASIAQLELTNQESIKKALEIAQMLSLIGEKGDALIDEVDMILDSHQELNYIDGIKIHVETEFNNLLHQIYKGLISDKISIESPNGNLSIRDYVKLHTNQQSILSSSDYLNYVTPIIAQYLTEKFKPLSMHIGAHKNAFIRYASGKIPEILQDFADKNWPNEQSEFDKHPDLKDYSTIYDDLLFLRYLKGLPHGSKTEQLTGNLISLTKHFLQELVQSTLSQTGERNYGLSPDPATPGKVIPYLGLHTPTNREYGYHWEAAAYQYQYGTYSKPKKEQILLIAENYEAAAAYYIIANGEKFDKTSEYEEFYEKFGVRLDRIKEPGQTEKAIEYISQNYKRLLEFQFELVTLYATYASETLTSNGLSLCRLLASIRSMSGTPWNYEGYIKSLAENFVKDPGTDGKIFDTLIRRAKEGRIHFINFGESKTNHSHSIKDFLQQLHGKHPRFKKIRGIIEPGGLFKKYGSNANVAKEWMEFIKELQEKEKDLPDHEKTVDPSIDAAIYFDKEPGHVQPNTVYVWKKGAKKPDKLGTSTYSELEKKGLIPKNYVVYIDERHCAGSDFLQIPDAINEMTFDEKMLLRTTSQGIMRLRQYLEEQDVDIILSQESMRAFYNEGKTAEDLLLHSGKVQSIHKTQSMEQYFTQQVQHLFDGHSRFAVLKAILAKNFDLPFAELVQAHEKFFVRKMHDAPMEQHGRLKTQSNTKKALIHLIDHKNSEYKIFIADQKIQSSVDKSISTLKEWIQNATCLVEKSSKISERIGIHQEIQQQAEQQSHNHKELAIESQIQIELKNYQTSGDEGIQVEEAYSIQRFISLVQSFINGNVDLNNESMIYKLQDQLAQFNVENPLVSNAPFQDIFKQRIFGTFFYFHTIRSVKTLSIFDTKHRPAKQILAIKDAKGRMNWLCLSEFEAGYIKKYLEEMYGSLKQYPFFANVWLVQPDGSSLVKYSEQELFNIKDESVLKGLLEINVLVGNVDFINNPRNGKIAETWLSSNIELKIKFLKYRTYHNSTQQNQLKNSPLISHILNDTSIPHMETSHFVCKKRLLREATRLGTFRPNSIWETKLLKPYHIRNLDVEFVPHLGLDWDKRHNDPDTAKAFEELARKKNISNDKDLKQAAEEHSKKQFGLLKDIQGGHILPHQVRWLPVEKVVILKNPSQIMTKERDKTTYYLSEEQVDGLCVSQKHLIPHINPDFISKLEHSWQIAEVPLEHVIKIGVDLAHLMTNEQLKRAVTLSSDHVAQLAKHLTLGQIDSLSFEEILLLPKEYHKYIKARHITGIRNPDFIRNLLLLLLLYPIQDAYTHVDPSMVEYIPNRYVDMLSKPEQIVMLKVEQLEHINYRQARHLRGAAQINRCPILLITEIDDSQVHHLNKEQIEQLNLQDINYFLTKEGFKKNFIPSHIIPQIRDVNYIANIDQSDVDRVDFNTLEDNHPFWRRISDLNVEKLPIEKVRNISKRKFVHLKRAETIKEIGFFDVVHLDKEQIRKRKNFRFMITYFLGVMTLGVALSVVSLFGYVFIPCTMCSERRSRSYRKSLNRNLKRVGHLFTTCLAA